MDEIFAGAFHQSPTASILHEQKTPGDPHSFVLLDANAAACEQVGFELSDKKGMKTIEVFPGEEILEIVQHFDKCVRTQKRIDLGEIVYGDDKIDNEVFRVTVTPISQTCVLVNFTNLTRLRRLESAARLFLENQSPNTTLQNEKIPDLLEEAANRASRDGLRILAFSVVSGVLFLLLASIVAIFLLLR